MGVIIQTGAVIVKIAISRICPPVPPTFHMEQLVSQLVVLDNICYLNIFLTSVQKIQVLFKSDNITESKIHFYRISFNSLIMKLFQTKVVQKIKTYTHIQ
jgi:hypothetical protein